MYRLLYFNTVNINVASVCNKYLSTIRKTSELSIYRIRGIILTFIARQKSEKRDKYVETSLLFFYCESLSFFEGLRVYLVSISTEIVVFAIVVFRFVISLNGPTHATYLRAHVRSTTVHWKHSCWVFFSENLRSASKPDVSPNSFSLSYVSIIAKVGRIFRESRSRTRHLSSP